MQLDMYIGTKVCMYVQYTHACIHTGVFIYAYRYTCMKANMH